VTDSFRAIAILCAGLLVGCDLQAFAPSRTTRNRHHTKDAAVPHLGAIHWVSSPRDTGVVWQETDSTAPHFDPLVSSQELTLDLAHQETQSLFERLRPAVESLSSNALTLQPRPQEINAYGHCCADAGTARCIDVCDGLILFAMSMSEAKAVDELTGSTLVEQYTQRLVESNCNGGSVEPIPARTVPAEYSTNAWKRRRQWDLFRKIMGFALAHELGHHARGHLACGGQRPTMTGPIRRQWEHDADTWALRNAPWTREGALLFLDFYARREAFIEHRGRVLWHSHPAPAERAQRIRSARDEN
jgi:hypothetical protein